MSTDPAAALKPTTGHAANGRIRRPEPEPEFKLPDLGPLEQSIEAAEDKVAAIGRVNPRPGGLLNTAVQNVKRLVSRLLAWHVREQVEYNLAVVRFLGQIRDASYITNRSLLRVAREVDKVKERAHDAEDRLDLLEFRGADVAQQVSDLRRHWTEWHPAWENKLTQAEIRLLHLLREIETTRMQWQEAQRETTSVQHRQYLEALSRTTGELQNQYWEDIERLKAEQERLIHAELRVIRRRLGRGESAPAAAPAGSAPVPVMQPAPAPLAVDYARFEERFRGDENYVTRSQSFYLPHFEKCRHALDLGCGRGEFLALLRERGVEARGVDLDADAVAACLEKGLDATRGDLFTFLDTVPDASVDGIFSAHVVEHLEAAQLPKLIEMAARKLRPGGVFAAESPNPNCLAIFAGDFYLDPTHRRPVPPKLVEFYLQEEGFVSVETHELHPADEVYPEVAALGKVPELDGFRRRFFGGLDYAVLGRKSE